MTIEYFRSIFEFVQTKVFSPVSYAFVREKRFSAYLPQVNVNFNISLFSIFYVYAHSILQ